MRYAILFAMIPILFVAGCTGSNGNATTHVRGPSDANVTIVEYSDFQCPACGMAEPIIKQVLAAYPTQVNFIYKDYPMPYHTLAQKASEAAECAGVQGKYWEMHDILFTNQNALSDADLKGYAVELGLDSAKFNTCLDTGAMRADVGADMEEAKAKGITATPSFFINGRKIVGAQPLDVWKAAIDSFLD
jgi:protein-disulfide isomerase